jgi:hypothetical protein
MSGTMAWWLTNVTGRPGRRQHRAVSEDEAARRRGQCARKAAEPGSDGVLGHRVRFSVTGWNEPSGLSASVPRTGWISRGDVLDIGERVRAGTLHAVDLFAACFVWVWDATGYGPRRYRDIRAAAGTRLEPSLHRVLAAIYKDRCSPDPPSRATPTCTAAATMRTGQRPDRSRGPGCMGSARRSSPSSCTSPRPAP